MTKKLIRVFGLTVLAALGFASACPLHAQDDSIDVVLQPFDPNPIGDVVFAIGDPIVLFNTLADTTSGASSIWAVNSVAQPFSTGRYQVDLIQVTLYGFTLSTTASDAFTLTIRASAADNTPGDVVETLFTGPGSGSGFTSASGNFDFLSGSTISLPANSTYWIVAESAAGYGAHPFWWHTDQSANDATAAVSGASGNWITAPAWQQMMKVEATVTAVPEPSAAAILTGLLALGLASFRRRR